MLNGEYYSSLILIFNPNFQFDNYCLGEHSQISIVNNVQFNMNFIYLYLEDRTDLRCFVCGFVFRDTGLSVEKATT